MLMQGAKRLGHGESYPIFARRTRRNRAQVPFGVEREYYRPVPRGFERELAERLEKIRARLREAKTAQPDRENAGSKELLDE